MLVSLRAYAAISWGCASFDAQVDNEHVSDVFIEISPSDDIRLCRLNNYPLKSDVLKSSKMTMQCGIIVRAGLGLPRLAFVEEIHL